MYSSKHKTYDVFYAMERLKDNLGTLGTDERDRLKAAVALTASDPQAAALYVDIMGNDWTQFYPPLPKAQPISTGKAIETFLDTYGKSTPEEDALLEKLIFNPVPEYGGTLAEESPAEDVSLGNLAREINSAPEEKPKFVSPQRQHGTLTLELAKIFVKQGRFDRAHEIISKIILNNPEKSVYFADQLRFLEKLIKIQNLRDAGKAE